MNANTRSTLLIGATLALGLGGVVVATAAPPDVERVAMVRYASTGDTATVTVSWTPRSQSVEYLVEWTIGDESAREVVGGTTASLRVVQHEVERAGTACVWSINRGGRLSGSPQCEAFSVPPSYPLVDAPEDVTVEVEHAPGIQWDSLRVAPGVIAFEALGEERTLYLYAYAHDTPHGCVTLHDGRRGWAPALRIAPDGSALYPEAPALIEDDCRVTMRSSDPETLEVVPSPGVPYVPPSFPAPAAGA